MITHQMEVVRDACSQVAVVHEGQVVEQGSVEEIFIRPKTDVTKDFLSRISAQQEENKKEFVRWSLDGGQYELHFIGDKTDSTTLSQLAKNFNIDFNVRAGGIQSVQGKKVGKMLVDFIGEESEITRAIEYLNKNGIEVEKNGSNI